MSIMYAVLLLFLIPSLIFIYSLYVNNFNKDYIESGLEYVNGITGFEALPQLEFEQSGDVLCGDAYHLGYSDVLTDCTSTCGADYNYVFVDEGKDVVINKVRLYGAYCMKSEISKCNLNTSMATVGLDGYKCISHFPTILGGVNGRNIIACGGRMKDDLLGVTYENFIPSNLSLSSKGFDEVLSNGKYRFTCATGVAIPQSIATRLETERDICSLLDPQGSVDFERSRCNCPKGHVIEGDETSICSACQSGFAVESGLYGWKYGYTISKDCIDPTNAPYEIQQRINFPCGEKTLVSGNACQKAILYSTNTYTPMALQSIYK